MIDFSTLDRPAAPNTALYADEGDTPSAADAPAVRLSAPPEAVFAAWDALMRAEPRTRIVTAGGDALLHHAVQRSAVFRFPDDVYAKVLPADGGSRVLLYSAARYGKADFGVNRRRLERLADALRDAV